MNKAANKDAAEIDNSGSICSKLQGFEFWKKNLGTARFILAPMVDQSELAWRMLSRKYGAQLCYTPMLHASVFIRDSVYRSEHLVSCHEDRPLIVQFCANEPEILLQAALLAQDHCDAVDLNLGCPQTIAKKGHYGAYLQEEWKLLENMVSLCHSRLSVPITCKVRVFEDIARTVDYARMLERAGCQLLAVHGRTVHQKGPNTGIASWAHIKAVRENVNIPVFANGNVQCLADALRCIDETGVQGVMIAEGSLHDPALFVGRQFPVWQMADEYMEMVDKYPCQLSAIRGHLFKIFHHALCVHTDLREMLGSCHDLEDIRNACHKINERLQAAALLEAGGNLSTTTSAIICKDGNSLPVPYWICQPYVRPIPVVEAGEMCSPDADCQENVCTPASEYRRKHNEAKLASLPVNVQHLSKNKQKKLLRYPHKVFEGNPARNFHICTNCKAHAMGSKCVNKFCKKCCCQKSSSEMLDCQGHCLLFTISQPLLQHPPAKDKDLEEAMPQSNLGTV